MSQLKDILTESGVMVTVPEAPVQQIDKDQITAAVARMRWITPGGEDMSVSSLTVIAQDSILFRTLPGREIHYIETKRGLQRIFDYKYLETLFSFKEQVLSGDSSAQMDKSFRTLSETEKVSHGIPADHIAASCTIITSRDRRQFAAEVKQWIDLGFTPQEAVALAKETYGDLGTTAIGTVDPQRKDKYGKLIPPPVGWSFLQYAEKLAFKNAATRKYGFPTVDEMRAMAYAMAHRALPDDWRNVPNDEPLDIQARLADLEAVARESAELQNGDTHQDRLERNTDLLRGNDIDDDIIDVEVVTPNNDDEEKARFAEMVKFRIPFYHSDDLVFDIMERLGLSLGEDTEESIFGELASYADSAADQLAQETQE